MWQETFFVTQKDLLVSHQDTQQRKYSTIIKTVVVFGNNWKNIENVYLYQNKKVCSVIFTSSDWNVVILETLQWTLNRKWRMRTKKQWKHSVSHWGLWSKRIKLTWCYSFISPHAIKCLDAILHAVSHFVITLYLGRFTRRLILTTCYFMLVINCYTLSCYMTVSLQKQALDV